MNPDVVHFFEQRLTVAAGKKVSIRINENRSTMLRILALTRDSVRLSMHRIFLESTEDVFKALVDYVSGRNSTRMRNALRVFIHKALEEIDYSERVVTENLSTQGKVYNLQELFKTLNAEYFENSIEVHLTWFGEHRRKCPKTLGEYHNLLQLVKIHRYLDNISCPDYFISFVLYHEMLHHVHPPYLDNRSHCRYHGAAFKQAEKRFRHYAIAKAWEKTNNYSIF